MNKAGMTAVIKKTPDSMMSFSLIGKMAKYEKERAMTIPYVTISNGWNNVDNMLATLLIAANLYFFSESGNRNA